jgi:UDP-N-acetylmuramoyl-tripeptide--D-alanyl-D-alanine ligase
MAGPRRAQSRLCDTGDVSDTRHGEPRSGAGSPALTAPEVAAVTGGRLVQGSALEIRGAAVDSRAVAPGNMFVALAGENTDGHRFLPEALAAGAAALLVREEALAADPGLEAAWAAADTAVVAVPDTLAGLHAVAGAWRRRFDPLVVGVTGSIAKTSTKEAVASVLSEGFATLKSEGNANNEIGLPLTILRLGPEHEAAVLEMGMYLGGEIAQLAAIARPRIGVVTAVHGVHLSRIGSIEAIEQAKAELVEALPAEGTAVLNLDDNRVLRMRERTAAAVLTYGFSSGADVRATNVATAGLDGMTFTLVVPSGSARVATPALGRHGVHNGLAAAAVGVAARLDLERIVAGLGRGWQAPHRDQLVRAGGITILDDSYNASPASMLAALELLSSLPGRHVAVLGEMLELGEAAERGHSEVGIAAGQRTELLVVVGSGAAAIGDAARTAASTATTGHRSATVLVANREEALEVLFERLRPGDAVLVKASRGAALDLVVADLVERFGSAGGASGGRQGARPAIVEAR